MNEGDYQSWSLKQRMFKLISSVVVPSYFPYATEYVLPCSKEIVKLFMYAYVISIMMNIIYYRCDFLIYICVIYSPKGGHKILP